MDIPEADIDKVEQISFLPFTDNIFSQMETESNVVLRETFGICLNQVHSTRVPKLYAATTYWACNGEKR